VLLFVPAGFLWIGLRLAGGGTGIEGKAANEEDWTIGCCCCWNAVCVLEADDGREEDGMNAKSPKSISAPFPLLLAAWVLRMLAKSVIFLQQKDYFI
jgi:hypothetical protein